METASVATTMTLLVAHFVVIVAATLAVSMLLNQDVDKLWITGG
jgi:hypothetical protein